MSTANPVHKSHRGRLPSLSRAHTRAHSLPALFDTFEMLVTSPDGFALTTPSPLQRAILRSYDGIDVGEDEWADPDVRAAFGDYRPAVGQTFKELCIVSGIRTAKTLFAAAGAVYQSQRCSFEHAEGHSLLAGEIPRVSIISLRKDVADAALNHIVGTLQTKPLLRKLLIGNPTTDSILLRHPTGRPVEIKVVAGARAGATLLGRWCTGVIFDEAPRMVGADEGVVNLIEMQDAVLGRMLRGARIWYIGSPYQPSGPVYDMVNERWGKPSQDLLVIKAPAWVMNPITWTEKAIADFRRRKPAAAQTDVDAEFADPETALFTQEAIGRATRKAVALPYDSGQSYVAAMDPATKGNAWTLVIATKADGKIKLAYCAEWRGSRASPLSPRETMREVADCLRMYGLSIVLTDKWLADAIRDFALENGVGILVRAFSTVDQVSKYVSFARRLEAGMVELPPIDQLRVDLLSVRRRGTRDGVKIAIPQTSDGRHGDYAPAAVLAASEWLEEPVIVTVDTDPEPEDERQEREALTRWEATVLDSGGLAMDDFDDEDEASDFF